MNHSPGHHPVDVKMMMLHQFHHVNRTKNTSILQVHLVIQCNPTSSTWMTKIQSSVNPGNPFTSHPNNPFIQQPVCSQLPAQTTVDTDATTIIGNTMSAVASEFKKMREPKLAKLKGGITSGASLFFNSWVKDVKAVILECSMSNAESCSS